MKKIVNLLSLVVLIGIFISFGYAIWEIDYSEEDLYYFDDVILEGEEYKDYVDYEVTADGWNPEPFSGWNDKTLNNTGNSTGSLTTFQKAFQEVAYAYYMRGPYIHYNSARGRGHDFSPEDATSQDYNYLACGLYVLNVYRQLLGHLSGNIITFPYHWGQSSYAKLYVGKRPEVIWYGEKSSGNLYRWDGSTTYTWWHNRENPDKNYIISQLKIGDILGYDGHVTMVYDYKYNESWDVEDVYLIHATDSQHYRVYSKIHLGTTIYDNSNSGYDLAIGHNKWSAIRYNHFDRTTQSGHHPDARVEWTVHLQTMSTMNSVLKFNTGSYWSSYYILRFVTTNDSGNSILSINGSSNAYNECSGCTYIHNNTLINYSDSVQSRLEYNKLYIEKTVDRWDNSVVWVDDELEYAIRIQNNSDEAYDQDLIVKENIDTNLVDNWDIYSYTKNWTPTDEVQLLNTGNQLQWNIGNLGSKDEVVIKYTVKVKSWNIWEIIESTGLVDNIPSWTLTNIIWKNTDRWENLKDAYNNLNNNFTGKVLINEIYKEVYGIDLEIDKIGEINTTSQSDTWALIYYNNKWWSRSTNWDNVNMRINRKSPYSGMVLNGYFNVLYKNINDAHTVNKSGNEITITHYGFPAIAVKSNDVDKRADTIFPSNFQTGDILIYRNSNDVYYNWNSSSWYAYISRRNTRENGEYAYIYIDWKFVGVNLGNDLVWTGDDRNEFTTGYYSKVGIGSRYTGSNNPTQVSQINMPGWFKNWLHYQTLFGKDAYVILRPSLMIRDISYELDGWVNGENNPSAFILGREIELNDPIKDGYTFQGWFIDSELTEPFNSLDPITEDIVLYAKWGADCTFQGQNMTHGSSLIVYSASWESCSSTCISWTVTCDNGTVSWDLGYTNLSCIPLPISCDESYILTSTGANGTYDSCTPYIVSSNSCTPWTTVYKLTHCANGYHIENGTWCTSNTKMVLCRQDGKPDNSSYVTEDIQVTRNGTWDTGSWSIADDCDWICDSGYSLVWNICKPDLTTFEKIFQEVAYAYYMRWPYIHHNSAKATSDILSPEESTSQDYHYMTSAPFVMNVYGELLGMVLTSVDNHYRDYAKNYVGKRPEVVWYGEKSGANLYWWDGTTQYPWKYNKVNPTQSYIISQLKIGDILYYEGHVMLVYDYVYSGNDIVDVYLLHSWQANYITKTKADYKPTEFYYNKDGKVESLKQDYTPLAEIWYNYRDRSNVYTGISRIEGTIILETLKEKARNDETLSFTGWKYQNYYAILRFVDADDEWNSFLNFDGQWSWWNNYLQFPSLGLQGIINHRLIHYSDSVQSRLKYSKLYIEKTVDKKDNNIVQSNDTLTYIIKIQNNSKKAYTWNLIVKENIDTNLVENLDRYIYTKNWIPTDKVVLKTRHKDQLQWNVGNLDSRDEVIIEYTVKVKTGHIGEVIESTGTVDNIPSGTVRNKIGKNTHKWEELTQSYNNLRDSYTGRTLINKIYEEAYGVNLGLDNLEILTNDSEDKKGLIYYNRWGDWWYDTDNGAKMYINKANTFSWMVLNSYFNSLFESGGRMSYNDVNITLYVIPNIWEKENNPDNMANTIYPTDFKNWDILIYTNKNDVKYSLSGHDTVETYITYEDGEYAYIYIDGKFVGVNLGKDGIEGTNDDRNEFTNQYYDDNNLLGYTKTSTTSELTDEFKEFLQYQTLFGKDTYVILRPSLAIRDISYELDGWINDEDNPSAFVLGRGIELKDPVKDGYTFKGWYSNPELTELFNSSDSISEDIVLYAKWDSSETNSGASEQTITYGNGWKLRRDNCPGWDYSDSYYDWTCEKTINTHNAPNIWSPYQRWEELEYDLLKYYLKYSDEMNKAYQYAYYYWITTKESIEDADVNWILTRVAMAKMLSQYAINVLWMEPDKTRQNTFVDVPDKLNSDYDDWVTLAYQLWIMWINMEDNKFRPYDYVTRAEFATALSRLLYWIEDGKDKYYSTHINLLKNLWIITNTDPKLKELRWYVMLMFIRSGEQ